MTAFHPLVSPAKPYIRRLGWLTWRCATADRAAYGFGPRDAYENWLRKAS